MSDLFNKPAAATADEYSAKDIEILEGLEPVRRRPGMYIGSTDERGLHHLVQEIVWPPKFWITPWTKPLQVSPASLKWK